jgi:hypothetical protein
MEKNLLLIYYFAPLFPVPGMPNGQGDQIWRLFAQFVIFYYW